ncbi:MAG: hybrid sensor histidine kinase/response regulator [Bacteroidales bacterium]|nr:hybrid sensor histidine kinase/response regulator [Bacteroidales bacterium]
MNKKEEEFKKRLLATYKIEADEHLKAISSGLLELEKVKNFKDQVKVVETIFRETHSLKGASRAVNLRDIETVCNSLESIFGSWKQKKIKPPPRFFDKLHDAIDFMTEALSTPEIDEVKIKDHVPKILEQLNEVEVEQNGGEKKTEDVSALEIEPILTQTPGKEQLEKEKPEIVEKEPQLKREKQATAETVRISKAKLNSLLMQTEEMLSTKLKLIQHSADIQDIRSILAQLKKGFTKLLQENRNIRQSKKNKSDNHHRALIQFSKQLETWEKNYDIVKLMENKLSELIKSTGQDQRSVGRMVDNLLDEMRNVLMLPFSSLLEIFPKFIRDLARDQGKRVDLVIEGAENEIDRRILEEMKDPLIHLVRNCIDHGIEKPEERVKNKKPPSGKVVISVTQLPGNKVEILISDDGAGIDLSKVKEKAVKEGIISEKEKKELTDQEAEALIYHSGISTSPIITDISGRGLGLAILREKVDALGGTVSMKSELHKGTTFCVNLPLTQATFRGIFVQVSEETFVIPTANVERTLRIKQNEIKMVENKQTISLNGSTISYIHLSDVLELRRKVRNLPDMPGREEKADTIQVLILGAGDSRIAFGADEILKEQEVLVKYLGNPLSRVRNIGGATVLGSGKVVPILNVSDLLKSAVTGAVPVERAAEAEREEEAKQKSVVVAEDSITARMLLKDILESAGFLVKTAVDGAEALSFLREGDFDILVSDIDMPRMDGFELTSKIRADKKLGELPVVLVTALKSREDKERGMEVGANAYIEKSTFTPQNLLSVVSKLV